jgi:leader peptidase (prepilin peptidase)/N-methyltransferase
MGFIISGFDLFELQSPYLELVAALIGVCVGSFLNVLALRSLSGDSIITPSSQCPKCKHKLGVLDLIPIVSYFCLSGRCRYCQEKISWHYPAVEALTAGLFAAIVHYFSQPVFATAGDERTSTIIAMLFLTSVLVAVTVTDFREKLIPHEITYPSIILGLIYSFVWRHDLLGALAGVGVSYILFDFIAFYGLKYFYFIHPELVEEDSDETEKETNKNRAGEAKNKADETKDNADKAKGKDQGQKQPQRESADSPSAVVANTAAEVEEIDDEIDRNMDIVRDGAAAKDSSEAEDDEPFEVMGGGDAVLSAVLAAWLGWEKLVVALVIGFMMGALMGAGYLLYELKQEKRLGQLLRPALLGFGLTGGAFAIVIVTISCIFKQTEMLANPTLWLIDLVVAFAGLTFGVIRSGNSITKPFPFGPALAFGGIYAIFMINITDRTFIK